MATKPIQSRLNFTKTIRILSGTSGYPSAVPGRSGYATYITKITLSITTHAAGDVYLFDDGGLAANPIAAHTDLAPAALVPSVIVWDFGSGTDLTPGASLDISHSGAGVATAIIEGFHVVAPSTYSTYSSQVRADGAIAYWRLDEPSGNFIDEISSIVGTPSGGITRNQSGALSDGNTAVLFDGVDASVISTAAASTSSINGTSNITLEAWVKPTVLSGLKMPIGFQGHASSYIGINGTALYAVLYDGTIQHTTSGGELTVGVWSHIAVTYNGAIQRIYLNGVQLSIAEAWVGTLVIGSLGLRIGGYLSPGFGWSGSIDEVAIYPTALSAAKVQAHYRAASTSTWTAPLTYPAQVVADGALGYWRLGESSGTVAVDSIGGNNGTYVNTPLLGEPGLVSDGNTSVLFDDINEYVTIGNIAALKPTAAVSMEAWIKPTNVTKALTAIGGPGSGSLTGYAAFIQGGTSKIEFQVGNGAAVAVASASPALVNGVVHHVVGTYDSTNIRIYVDGVLAGGPTALAGPIVHNANSIMIGAPGDVNLTRTFGGTIDEFAIYSVALTPTQIQEHYKARLPQPTTLFQDGLFQEGLGQIGLA